MHLGNGVPFEERSIILTIQRQFGQIFRLEQPIFLFEDAGIIALLIGSGVVPDLTTSSIKNSESTLMPCAKSCFSLSKCALIVSRIWMRRMSRSDTSPVASPAFSTMPLVNSTVS